MRVSERGLSLIRQYEGFESRPYICPAGKKTIGFGHVMTADEVCAEDGISEDYANILLKQDIALVEAAFDDLIQVVVSQNQYDALAALAYNIGIHAFEKSTLLELLNEKDFSGAVRQFGRWIYAGGKPLGGLEARRNAEMELFLEKSTIIV